MARPKSKAPARRYHISGQSVVTINGRDFYLGPHDSPEAIARYAVLIGLYNASGKQLPDDLTRDDLDAKAAALISFTIAPQDQTKTPKTVRHVTACYREFATTRYADSLKDRLRITKLCNELDQHEGDTEADKFGPLALQRQRERFVEAGNSRNYCNRQANLIVRMFRHAVSQELVSADTWQRLKSVEPLRFGQTKAKESDPIKPVPIEDVRATAKYLTPVLRAMLRVQVATGMRPSEVCKLRPCDIDRSQDVWMYRPQKHKTAYRGKRKAVPILNEAREAIIEYLNRPMESHCFSAAESFAWRSTQKRMNRKTKVQPSQRNRRKADPAKTPGDHYTSDSYRRAIEIAAKAAGVEPWHPYQIRHLTATAVRDALGVEHVAAILGHSQIQMAEHYSKLAEGKAIEAAQHTPKL